MIKILTESAAVLALFLLLAPVLTTLGTVLGITGGVVVALWIIRDTLNELHREGV